MAYTWSDINNGDAALGIRTKINGLGNEVALLSSTFNLELIGTYTNVTVATSAWVSDTTYANYPYRAPITASNVLATDIPFVAFSATDQESGTYIGADSGAGVIYIYASAIPSANMTIPLAFALRVVSA